MTPTISPTVTPTPPMAYLIKISVYNEAGELVAIIATVQSAGGLTSVVLSIDGQPGSTSVILGETSLRIFLPGVDTSGQIGLGGSWFTWNGENAQGQDAASGPYYIVVDQIDTYGHDVSITKQINVIDNREYVEMNVFNAAGELVKSIRQYGAAYSGSLMVDVPDVITIDPAGGNSVVVKYSGNAGDSITWDGKDNAGLIVSNGIYEIQILVKDSVAGTVMAEKTVSILNSGKVNLGKIAIVPNPFREEQGSSITITWDGAMEGRVSVSILNIAGERVKELTGDLNAGSIAWNTNTASGSPVPNGLYIVIVEGKSASGYMDRKIQKLAILRSLSR
jgi:flagellar hook assembly protein FlgD